jgi:hypothetical protein
MTRVMHTVDRTANRADGQGKKDDSRADTRDSAQRWENVLLIWLEGVGGKGINFTCKYFRSSKIMAFDREIAARLNSGGSPITGLTGLTAVARPPRLPTFLPHHLLLPDVGFTGEGTGRYFPLP